MSEATPAVLEHTLSPETLSPSERMDGAQLRFVLHRGLLDPAKEIPDTVKPEDLGNIDNRSYSAFQNASTFNRIEDSKKLVAEHKLSSDTSEQKKQWIATTSKVFNSENNKSKLQKLTPVLQKLGAPDSSEASFKALYERLFENESLEKYDADGKKYISSDVKAFVRAVLDTHTHNGRLSYDSLSSNMAEYKWFAKVFGTEMQEAVMQMIDAEARIKTDKTKFITETTTKVNNKSRAATANLKPTEKHILEYIHKNGKINSSPAEPSAPHHPEPHDTPHTTEHDTTEKTKSASDSSFPWDLLAKSPLTAEHPELIIRFQTAQEVVKTSGIMEQYPFYYQGAAEDIVSPLAYTDATTFVFNDERYVNKKGDIDMSHQPDKVIESIGGTNIKISTEGKLGKGGSRIIEFDWGRKRRKIIQYAEDPAQFTPPEIKNGAGFTHMNFHDENISEEKKLRNFNVALKKIETMPIKGFTSYRGTSLLPCSLIGLGYVVPPTNESMPLIVKTAQEPNIKEILQLDTSLLESIDARNGSMSGSVKPENITVYTKILKEARLQFEKLSSEKKQLIIQEMMRFFNNPALIPAEKERFESHGLKGEENQMEYLQKLNAAAVEVFPELKAA